MTLSATEQLALDEAFRALEKERKEALRAMFGGTQLEPRSHVADAKTLAKEAKAAKEKIGEVPGLHVPTLNAPSLNLAIFKGIDLRALVKFRLPSISLPDVNLSIIPDIRLGSLPGFSLPKVRLNLNGILKYKDLLPDISLRALAYALAVKWPDLRFPSLMVDLSRILDIDVDILFPDLRLAYPNFFRIDLQVELPSLTMPDLSLPNLPSISVPRIDLSSIRVDIPGIDIPRLLEIPGFYRVLTLLFELFDAIDLQEILLELGAEFLTDFLSSALPIVQQVKSGAQAAKSWGTAAQEWHKARKTADHRPFLLPGDARAACDALRVLLERSRNEHATLATIQTTQLAVSTAGLFADLGGATGPAVAAAASVAKLCQKVVIMGARYKERKKVNLILRTTPENTLSAHLFEVSPLLGCYFLVNSTTSTVLNALSSNIIEDRWMDNAEANKRNHLDPLIRDAQRFIADARYVLTPLRQTTGMYVELGFSEKIKKGVTLAVKKRLGRAPATAKVPTHRYIG